MNNTTNKTMRKKMNWKAEAERACNDARDAWRMFQEQGQKLIEADDLCKQAAAAINNLKVQLAESEKKATELGNQLFDMTDKNAMLRSDLEAARRQARQWFSAAVKLYESIGCIIPKTED